MPKNSTTTLSKPLIGVGGTNGSGKDTVCNYLVEQRHFYFISVSDVLRDEVRRRGLEVTREALWTVSAELRRQSNNLGVLVSKSIEIFNQQSESFSGLTVASIRNPGEVDTIHNMGGIVIWLDADAKTRYQRVNSADRGRSGEDRISYKQFIAEEQAEMNQEGDTATLSLLRVKDKADIELLNNSDLASFKKLIDKSIASYLSSFSL